MRFIQSHGKEMSGTNWHEPARVRFPRTAGLFAWDNLPRFDPSRADKFKCSALNAAPKYRRGFTRCSSRHEHELRGVNQTGTWSPETGVGRQGAGVVAGRQVS